MPVASGTKKRMQYVCAKIWDWAESHNCKFGWLAPYIFGGMIGRWPRRKT